MLELLVPGETASAGVLAERNTLAVHLEIVLGGAQLRRLCRLEVETRSVEPRRVHIHPITLRLIRLLLSPQVPDFPVDAFIGVSVAALSWTRQLHVIASAAVGDAVDGVNRGQSLIFFPVTGGASLRLQIPKWASLLLLV